MLNIPTRLDRLIARQAKAPNSADHVNAVTAALLKHGIGKSVETEINGVKRDVYNSPEGVQIVMDSYDTIQIICNTKKTDINAVKSAIATLNDPTVSVVAN